MNNNIIVTLKSSTTEMNLNSHEEGIYLIPDLEGLTSLPEIRTSSGVNAGADGGWTSAQFFDARSIAMKVVISNEDVSVVEQKRQALNSLLAQGRKEDLLLTVVTEAGNAYTVYVRPTSVSSALNQVLKAQEMLIQFRADDPLIYGEGSAGGEEAILHVQQALGGFAIPFKFPLAIGGGSGATTITNSGSESVYPVITLEGPLHSPTVINRTTNQQIQVLVDLANTINWAGQETAQGKYIQVTNQLDIPAALKSASLLGDTEQQTYTGKNLLPMINTTRTINGVTFTPRADGSIALSGTASAQTNYPINVDSTSVTRNIQLSAGTYTVSWGSNPASSGMFVQAYYTVDGGSGLYSTGTFTVSGTQATLGAYIRVKDGINTNGTVIYPMLEAGNTATDYEPYVGGTASPNPDYPQEVNVVTGEQVVKIEGKNLFDVGDSFDSWFACDTNGTRIINGDITTKITGSISNNKITITSYDSSGGYWWMSKLVTLPKNETLTAMTADGTHMCLNVVGFDSLEANTIGTVLLDWRANSTTAQQFNTGDYKFYAVTIYPSVASGNNSGIVDRLQLELGSTATAFEPYQGQSYEVNLGKNLLDTDGKVNASAANLTLTRGKDGSISWNGTAGNTYAFITSSIPISLEAGDYTFSIGNATNIRISLRFTHTDNTTTDIIVNSNTTERSGTLAKPSKSVQILLTNMTSGTAYSATIFPMLEKGSQATTYSPYFTPIELAKIGTYQDRIYKTDGKWYVEKQVGKVVFDGTENWTSQGGGAPYTIDMPDFDRNTNEVRAISDNFLGVKYNANWNDYSSLITSNSSNDTVSRFKFRYTAITSLADWKTWLASNPTTVYYALATPTDTEITNTALIAQLDALMEAQLYVGDNNISTTSVDLPAYLDIAFFTEYTRSIDKVVIDSQLQTVTFNGLDIYHQLSESSEFITIAPGENEMILTSTNTSDEGTATIKFKQGYLSI